MNTLLLGCGVYASLLTMQFVECINISNQSLLSSALGSKDTRYAFSVVKRHLLYSTLIVSVLGALLLVGHEQIIRLFTPDKGVIAAAWSVLPLVVVCFPLDAIGAIADGTLTAAGYATAFERRCNACSLPACSPPPPRLCF